MVRSRLEEERKLEESRAISGTSSIEIEDKRENWKNLRAILGLCQSRLRIKKELFEITKINRAVFGPRIHIYVACLS